MNIFFHKREGSPDFALGSGGVKYEELADYINEKGYVNFDLRKGREGGYYIKVSEYGINKPVKAETTDEEIPF